MAKRKKFSASYGSDEYEFEIKANVEESGEVVIGASLKTNEDFLKKVFKSLSDTFKEATEKISQGSFDQTVIPEDVRELLEALKSAAEAVKTKLEKK